MNTAKTIMDNRKINLSPWKEVSLISEFEHHTLIEMATLIIEKDNEFFFIYEDIEKIRDVSIMPSYIKEDWIKYNRKELNVFILNKSIKEHETKLKSLSELNPIKTEEEWDLEETIQLLRKLRRDIIIKGII